MTDTATTLQDIFTRMPGQLNPDAAKGMNCVIQYDLTGDAATRHHSVIKDGACTVFDGVHEAPTMTLTMSAENFVALTHGELDGMSAFMSGKLKVSGDMGLAMKMGSLFRTA